MIGNERRESRRLSVKSEGNVYSLTYRQTGRKVVIMDTSQKLLLRPAEAAELVSISRALAYRYIASGELPSVKLGRSIRVPADKLREFVERLSAGDSEAAQR